jgi:uncharacterized protein (TIGR03086 family)
MTPGLRPATGALAGIIRGVRDDQLDAPTPCSNTTVGELLDHVDSLCAAFAAAASKSFREDGGRAPVPDASRLGTDWRQRLPARLGELAQAWQPATAWTGTTQAGGNELPAEIAGSAALDEVIVHGWDLAVATGQPFPGDDPALAEALQTSYAWARSVVEQSPHGSPGLFGPPVPVPDDAPLLDQLLGLTGRHPFWRPDTAPCP